VYPLVWSLLKPYRGTLLIILLAMLLQMVATVATPWPLKIVLDNVVGEHKLPHWMDDFLRPFMHGETKMEIAAAAAIALVLIVVLGAVASYVANYCTTSVGQWVANDLRIRTYDRLQHLSLNYYNTHEMGTLLSTITADVQTIQGFASSSTLGIVVDFLTIVGMLAIMFWLNWDFTLIAVAVTPFMLLIISRFKKAIKKATKEVRKEQAGPGAGRVERGQQSDRGGGA
jgi:subfamily B ATP-binding cassette protein MsbA